MSKPRRIDDHAFWAGGKSKGSVFPEGAKTKEEHSAEGAGAEHEYEDTTDAIERVQKAGASKAKAHPLKSGYRY
jgi:hypothetical protein